jgi:hypothetical protein
MSSARFRRPGESTVRRVCMHFLPLKGLCLFVWVRLILFMIYMSYDSSFIIIALREKSPSYLTNGAAEASWDA